MHKTFEDFEEEKDMLRGCFCRMYTTRDEKELEQMHKAALARTETIRGYAEKAYRENKARLSET